MTTIYDVARAAGVSSKTVSRVINGDAPVNENTRRAVHAAIAELSYVPSKAARSMRSNKSGLIGLISSAMSTPRRLSDPAGLPAIHIVQGTQQYFATHEKTLLMADTGGQDDKIPELIHTFMEHRVEGLIYVAEFHQQVDLPTRRNGPRVVLANCFDDAGTPAVVPDDRLGGAELVEGLIERGHSRIGFLTLPNGYIATDLRLAGYRDALAAAAIPFDATLVMEGAAHNPEREYESLPATLDRLLGLPVPPTAICCGNDKMAMRVYALLRERGMRIPEEISVAGYDDYSIITHHLHPALTSVGLPYHEMGARAAARMVNLLAGTEEPDTTVVERISGPVTWRQSTTFTDAGVTTFKSNRRNR